MDVHGKHKPKPKPEPRVLPEQPAGTPGKRLTILSLDGGGIRGMVPSVLLECLETELQARDGPDARLAEYFDVIAGTSTGSFIATILNVPNDAGDRPRYSHQDVKDFYLIYGGQIFSNGSSGTDGPKYDPDPLKAALTEYVKDFKVADAFSNLFLVAYDIYYARPVFFNKKVATNPGTLNVSMVDACLSSGAPPTLFPPHTMEPIPPYEFNTIDGAVIANNPTSMAILHAFNDLKPETLASYQDLLVLSLGTGAPVTKYTAEEAATWGAAEWILPPDQPILTIFNDGIAYLADFDVSSRFQLDGAPNNYLRLQTNDIVNWAIDDASADNLAALEAAANRLLDAQAMGRSVTNGVLELTPQDYSNRQALANWAGWLSDERKARRSKKEG